MSKKEMIIEVAMIIFCVALIVFGFWSTKPVEHTHMWFCDEGHFHSVTVVTCRINQIDDYWNELESNIHNN
jgi:hypothetical protein